VVRGPEGREFGELDWSEGAQAMAGTLGGDGRNALDAQAVHAAGQSYEGVGRGTLASFAR
ncbi:MAG: hypothetical protein ACEQSX_19845, partial [Baekduiaceae bacterium]